MSEQTDIKHYTNKKNKLKVQNHSTVSLNKQYTIGDGWFNNLLLLLNKSSSGYV